MASYKNEKKKIGGGVQVHYSSLKNETFFKKKNS